MTAEAAPRFDRLAAIYRWMEWISFGPFLGICRSAFLDRLRDSRKVLVIGDGDGRFTARLLAENRHVSVDAVDASPAMLSTLQLRSGVNAGRVRVEAADARNWQPGSEDQWDAVATHFFLDCLTTGEVLDLAQRIEPALKPGALWVISEFSIPANLYGRWFARALISFLYLAFRVLTGLRVGRLPDYDHAFRQAGFNLLSRRNYLGGLLVSELWRKPG